MASEARTRILETIYAVDAIGHDCGTDDSALKRAMSGLVDALRVLEQEDPDIPGQFHRLPAQVDRQEDMSPDGRLRLTRDDDGDIYVEVFGARGSDEYPPNACVEFTTIGPGGGKSEQTMNALRALFVAMHADNGVFAEGGES